MFKELKNLIYILTIFFFLFLLLKYYFSDENKKNSYRSFKQIDKKIILYSQNLVSLKDDTNNIIEYVKKTKDQNKKKYNFWKLIENNG